jgi:hypothetical protein
MTTPSTKTIYCNKCKESLSEYQIRFKRRECKSNKCPCKRTKFLNQCAFVFNKMPDDFLDALSITIEIHKPKESSVPQVFENYPPFTTNPPPHRRSYSGFVRNPEPTHSTHQFEGSRNIDIPSQSGKPTWVCDANPHRDCPGKTESTCCYHGGGYGMDY